ncbi:hypothetical protein FQZ97_1270270 [compost metagenome]
MPAQGSFILCPQVGRNVVGPVMVLADIVISGAHILNHPRASAVRHSYPAAGLVIIGILEGGVSDHPQGIVQKA